MAGRAYIAAPTRLGQWRQALGLSQEETAKLTGLPQQVISDLERGARKPSQGERVALAKIVGDVDDFFPPHLFAGSGLAPVLFVLRALLGVQCATLAEVIQLPVRTVRAWESGLLTPTSVECRLLLDAFRGILFQHLKPLYQMPREDLGKLSWHLRRLMAAGVALDAVDEIAEARKRLARQAEADELEAQGDEQVQRLEPRSN